jgi:hypothetical protein
MANSLRKVWMWRRTLGPIPVGCAILSCSALFAALAPACAAAAEGKPPRIVTTGWGIDSKVTVEAQINPEGLETSYEIGLECQICGPAGYSPSVGQLPGVEETRTVRLDLTGIQPGSYKFDVRAGNAAGEAFWQSELTVPVPPPGACPDGCSTSPPYDPEISRSSKPAEEESATIVREYEARQRHLATEQEEANARATAMRAAEEAALKPRQEEPTAVRSEGPACTVPSLRDDTLKTARRALAKAHCRLGKVSRQARHHSAFLVIHQSPRYGKELPGGATVAVKLGSTRPGKTSKSS